MQKKSDTSLKGLHPVIKGVLTVLTTMFFVGKWVGFQLGMYAGKSLGFSSVAKQETKTTKVDYIDVTYEVVS